MTVNCNATVVSSLPARSTDAYSSVCEPGAARTTVPSLHEPPSRRQRVHRDAGQLVLSRQEHVGAAVVARHDLRGRRAEPSYRQGTDRSARPAPAFPATSRARTARYQLPSPALVDTDEVSGPRPNGPPGTPSGASDHSAEKPARPLSASPAPLNATAISGAARPDARRVAHVRQDGTVRGRGVVRERQRGRRLEAVLLIPGQVRERVGANGRRERRRVSHEGRRVPGIERRGGRLGRQRDRRLREVPPGIPVRRGR